MRYPILNDRGQFRFTDFVGYMPDFLKTEPDVVTLLQVMSDYINNAYRNIDTIEKFEFKLIAREDRVESVKHRMENLRSMLELAANRNDTAVLLSVPRANTKSNVTFGKNTGKSAYTVNYTGEEIIDQIKPATVLDSGISNFSDGDVIFVNYISLKDGSEIHPYYYDRGTNSLIKEPMGTSQDPFTDTPNQPSRIVTFKVSDVTTVKQRFGSLVDNNKYFEIFFTARIKDVASESSVVTLSYDVDLKDGTDDEIIVDYYNSEFTGNGKYHTYIRFFKKDGWAWNDGFPTCIFYLRDSTNAKITSIQANDESIAAMEVCGDPSMVRNANRYAIRNYTINKDNSITVQLESYYPMYDTTSVYLMNRKTGVIIGEYTLVGASSMAGTISSTLIPVSHVNTQDILSAESLVLVEIPLFYNRGVLNYAKSKAFIKWTGETQLNSNTSKVIYNENTSAKACESFGLTVVGRFALTREQITGGAIIEFPKAVSKNLDAFTQQHGFGQRLYCNNVYWPGVAKLMAKVGDTIDGSRYRLETYDFATGTSVPIRVNSGETTDLTIVDSGYIICTNEEDEFTIDGYWKDIAFNTSGETYVMLESDNRMVFTTVTKVSDDTLEFSVNPPSDTYLIHIMKTNPLIGVSGFLNLDEGNEYKTGTCKKYKGNVFGTEYMMSSDENGNVALMHCISDVRNSFKYEKFEKGEFVYDETDKQVYVCTRKVFLGENDLPSGSDCFKVDRIAHFSVPYRTSVNAFMPYYGSFTTLGYGENVDYTQDIDMVLEPLYIAKIEEHALKYGWEHREFLNYASMINMSKRDRNGFAEFMSTKKYGDDKCMETTRDIVDSSLADRAAWGFTYPVVKNGRKSILNVDIDNPISVSATRTPSGNDAIPDNWTVSVESAAHGLVEGCRITVEGLGDVVVRTETGSAILNLNTSENNDAVNPANGYATVHVVDGDHFTYSVPGSDKILTEGPVSAKVDGAEIVYSRDLIYRVITEPAFLPEKSAADELHDYYNFSIESPSIGLPNGTKVQLLGFNGLYGIDYEVANDDKENNQTVTIALAKGEMVSCALYPRIVRSIEDESVKYVLVNNEVYEITDGDWIYHDRYDIPEPSVLYSKANLFDSTVTNYPYAIGEPIQISHIEYIGDDRAVVRLNSPITSFTADNADILNNRARVYIRNVYPSEYCGWHLVTNVYNPFTFEIAMKLRNQKMITGVPISGTEMTCYEGRWYKYTINEIEWAKRSNCATYSTKNTLSSPGSDGRSFLTKFAHNFKVGDYAIVAYDHQFYEFDNTNSRVGEWTQVRITKVTSDRGIEFEPVYQIDDDGTFVAPEDIADVDYVDAVIVKGVILYHPDDNIDSLKQSYSIRLKSLNNELYRFTPGSIVVAMAQVNSDEIGAYMVEETIDWAILRRKRIMKISDISVEKYYNAEYDAAAEEDGLDEYKYQTYSDVDVYNDTNAYISNMQRSRNAHFERPSLDNMDTMRNPNAEYSSAEDFSTIAPRYDMKKSFKGVPDMTYPLVEKIERLSYLRDADVIDFDLIGYLARFMGYDITSASDDIETSNIYKTVQQQQKAIRETVANLPQYYALGGTEAGLRMLIATFGIISDVLTLYTNTTDPYGELLTKSEVDARIVKEERKGEIIGSWVPTPYISIEITDDARFPQFALQQSDIPRIKEQIRVWKPINVVFKDFILKYTGIIDVNASITGVTTSGRVNGGAACVNCATGQQLDAMDTFFIQYEDDELNNCSF